MLEIVGMVLAAGGLSKLAKLRGGRGWPWAVALAVGYVVVANLAVLVVGKGPHLFFGVGYAAVLYLSLFLVVGRGRRLKSTWQCPNCNFYNEPTTLVCPCGQAAPAEGP